jgi:hypothetical protein
MAIIFRTSDGTKWGSGKGSNLNPTEVDTNFWELLARIILLEHDPPTAISIDHFTITGNNLYVHLTDASVKGPYVLPMARWTSRGVWAPSTIYNEFDIFTYGGAAYLVLIAHTSQPSFDPGYSAGPGQDYYGIVLEAPALSLPAGGTAGQVLAKVDGTDFSTYWADLADFSGLGGGGGGATYYDVSLSFPGALDAASGVLCSFVVPRDLTLPALLPGSQAVLRVAASASNPSVDVYVNGTGGQWVGTIQFTMASKVGAFDASVDPIVVHAGDVITVEGPNVTDADAAGLSVTLVLIP